MDSKSLNTCILYKIKSDYNQIVKVVLRGFRAIALDGVEYVYQIVSLLMNYEMYNTEVWNETMI